MARWLVRFSASAAILVVVVLMAGATSPSALGTAPTPPLVLAAHLMTPTVKAVKVGSDPVDELYDTDNHYVYVADAASNTVSAIDSTTLKVTPITVKSPELLTYDPKDKDVYAENSFQNTETVINPTNGIAKNVTLPGLAWTQVYDPATGAVYVEVEKTTAPVGYELSEINSTTFALTNVKIPSPAIELTYDNASTSLVATGLESNNITVISSTNVVTTVKLTTGIWPFFAVYNPDDKDLYITDIGESSTGMTKTANVTVLSKANKIVATIKTGAGTFYGAYDPSSHDIYEVNVGHYVVGKPYPKSTVSIIGTNNKVAATLTLGKYCVIPTYNPVNGEMYISCPASNQTFAIDSSTNAIANKITTPQSATASLYDPALGDQVAIGDSTFFDNASTARTVATLIPSSNTGTSKVTLGQGPVGDVLYDPSDSGLWVTNLGAKSVSVLL